MVVPIPTAPELLNSIEVVLKFKLALRTVLGAVRANETLLHI